MDEKKTNKICTIISADLKISQVISLLSFIYIYYIYDIIENKKILAKLLKIVSTRHWLRKPLS